MPTGFWVSFPIRWSAPCAGTAGAAGGSSAIDGGGRRERIFFFRKAVGRGTGDDRQGPGGDPGEGTPAGGRTRDRIDSRTRGTAGSTDSAAEKGESWIGQPIGRPRIGQQWINAVIPYAS